MRTELLGFRPRVQALTFRRRWGFPPPPPWSDWVGYEVLLEEIERLGLDRIEGDVLEIGAFLGGIASFATNRVIATQVWTVRIFDPISLGVAISLIAALGGVACFHPAFRATRVDPAVTLRQE